MTARAARAQVALIITQPDHKAAVKSRDIAMLSKQMSKDEGERSDIYRCQGCKTGHNGRCFLCCLGDAEPAANESRRNGTGRVFRKRLRPQVKRCPDGVAGVEAGNWERC